MKILIITMLTLTFAFAQNHGTSGIAGNEDNGSDNGGGSADFLCNQLRESIVKSIEDGVYPSYAAIHPDFDPKTQLKPFLKNYYMELLLISTSKKKNTKKDVEQIICDQDFYKFDNLDFLELNGDTVDKFDFEKYKRLNIELKDLSGLYSHAVVSCQEHSGFYFKFNQMINVITNHFDTLIAEGDSNQYNNLPN